ncbi:MAG: uroporphyrinogen-III C-methyltransferase [gamma proteobacterium endosymbiont of Lamellibrachia anaximandri]|nr:uroporphyrinogen-III C-methyltransferase [gamma proteobacterium endosymbiont of Lamellibrachia anaximandri]MBL3532362.1 uroporphyrinogen-III C-methyltransferase [gamma proteobacterium endosymbiont of Lamellibrachia anaximandri]
MTEQEKTATEQKRVDASIEPVAEADSGAQSTGLGSRQSSGNITKLAVVLAVIALLAVCVGLYIGHNNWQEMQQSLQRIDTDLSRRAQEQSTFTAGLEETRRVFELQQQQIESQRQALADQHQQLQQSHAAMQAQRVQMADSLSDMQRRLGSDQGQWRISEAEYLMRVANYRLTLEGDVATSITALEAADSRLRATLDPAWNSVREEVAREIAALKIAPIVDMAGLSARIGGLIKQVDQLPLRDQGGLAPRPVQASESAEPLTAEGFNLRKILDDLWEGFKSMMVVRHHDRPIAAMLPPKQRYFLYQNLQLKLEGAKVALLARDAGLYRDSLTTAAEWIEGNFEMQAGEVQAFMAQLQGLGREVLLPDLPDISGSLRTLHARREMLEKQGERP